MGSMLIDLKILKSLLKLEDGTSMRTARVMMFLGIEEDTDQKPKETGAPRSGEAQTFTLFAYL